MFKLISVGGIALVFCSETQVEEGWESLSIGDLVCQGVYAGMTCGHDEFCYNNELRTEICCGDSQKDVMEANLAAVKTGMKSLKAIGVDDASTPCYQLINLLESVGLNYFLAGGLRASHDPCDLGTFVKSFEKDHDRGSEVLSNIYQLFASSPAAVWGLISPPTAGEQTKFISDLMGGNIGVKETKKWKKECNLGEMGTMAEDWKLLECIARWSFEKDLDYEKLIKLRGAADKYISLNRRDWNSNDMMYVNGLFVYLATLGAVNSLLTCSALPAMAHLIADHKHGIDEPDKNDACQAIYIDPYNPLKEVTLLCDKNVCKQESTIALGLIKTLSATDICCNDGIVKSVTEKLEAVKAQLTDYIIGDEKPNCRALLTSLLTADPKKYMTGKWRPSKPCFVGDLQSSTTSSALSAIYELFEVSPGAAKGTLSFQAINHHKAIEAYLNRYLSIPNSFKEPKKGKMSEPITDWKWQCENWKENTEFQHDLILKCIAHLSSTVSVQHNADHPVLQYINLYLEKKSDVSSDDKLKGFYSLVAYIATTGLLKNPSACPRKK